MRTGDLLLETLALRPRVPASQLQDAWHTVPPRGLGALLAFEGGSIWLLRRLREMGASEVSPASLMEALWKRATAEQARNMLVDAETEEVVRFLTARDIPHVLIKGNARRASVTRYPYADARATIDVDVLLPKRNVQETWDDLRKMGWPYATDPAATPSDHYHPPPLLGPHGVSVELHWSTGYALTPDEAWRRANDDAAELVWHGVSVRVPCATELLWHGLTHAFHAGPFGFRLRYLLDGASILASGADIDWNLIVARLEAEEDVDAGPARAWLGTAAILAGCDLPASVAGHSAAFNIARALGWRLAVLTRGGTDGFTGRLLEEGTRVELGLEVAPVIRRVGRFKQARRWFAGRAARLAYRTWRVAARDAATRRRG